MAKPSLSQNLNAVSEFSSSIPRILQNLIHTGNFLRFRYFTFKNSYFGTKISGNFVKNVVKNSVSTVYFAFSGYREAVGLQIEAFWWRNYRVLLGVVGFVLSIVLWRVRALFGIVRLSQGRAKYGFLALSAAIVLFAVIGVPCSATHLRAYVMLGGRIVLKDFKSRIRTKQYFLIFPIRGYDRKCLYDTKLLSVDIPIATGPDQRPFLIDKKKYRIAGGRIPEPRDLVAKAMTTMEEFEDQDQMENRASKRVHQDIERRHHEEIEKLGKGNLQQSVRKSLFV